FELVVKLLFKSNDRFVFREWALLLYSLNYLVAPAITYGLDETQIKYIMKIPANYYFSLAFPGFILFAVGMYIIPTNIFRIEPERINQGALLNRFFLIKITVIALVFRLATSFVSSELSFVFYLLGLIRFVSAFALLSIDRKLWYWSVLVLAIELITGFLAGAYHDALMWLIFFCLYFVYVLKPNITIKFVGLILLITFVLFIQSIKFLYRQEVWEGGKEASLANVYDVSKKQSSSQIIIGEDNLLGTLNRGNQAWIFASTVDNMDRNNDFQGMNLVNEYLKAAILPRFLAKDKIKSGDQKIFNEFSGHTVNESTAMGLGIFADGYIAFGKWGVYFFGLALGLIFGFTFKLVERWTKVSPFYVLLLFPLLNYAVRPDCELQTTINHLFKGILVYGFLVYLTKHRFTLDSSENKRKLLHLNLMK
ncbi:MAG: hypothetical protein RL059_633, partial [Bacteroidota bacterium]